MIIFLEKVLENEIMYCTDCIKGAVWATLGKKLLTWVTAQQQWKNLIHEEDL